MVPCKRPFASRATPARDPSIALTGAVYNDVYRIRIDFLESLLCLLDAR